MTVAYRVDPALPAVTLEDIACSCGRPLIACSYKYEEDIFWALVYRAQRSAAGLPPPRLTGAVQRTAAGPRSSAASPPYSDVLEKLRDAISDRPGTPYTGGPR